MKINGAGQYKTITNNLKLLNINGVGNKITIKSHISSIDISGTNNKVEGLDPNCKVDKLIISGLGNDVNLNQNCSNVDLCITGLRNNFRINGNQVSQSNNNNYNNSNVRMFNGQRVISINNFNNSQNLFNDFNQAFGNLNLNVNMNSNIQNNYNANNNSNVDDNNNDDNNDENVDPEFEEKKQKLILEMDEFQYKHISKYESRKETECVICLAQFKGTDIIKVFVTCDHIFHKKCLLNWLKKSNTCPLCKHDLTNDIE